MAAGHAYYFLEDVYPRMSGRRLLKTPGIIKALFPGDTVTVAPVPVPAANLWAAGGVPGENNRGVPQPGEGAEEQELHMD